MRAGVGGVCWGSYGSALPVDELREALGAFGTAPLGRAEMAARPRAQAKLIKHLAEEPFVDLGNFGAPLRTRSTEGRHQRRLHPENGLDDQNEQPDPSQKAHDQPEHLIDYRSPCADRSHVRLQREMMIRLTI